MSQQGRAAWFKVGGLAILFLLAAYILVSLEAEQKGKESVPRRTTYSAAPGGCKALYLWLQALGVPIKRWEKPLGHLSAEPSVLLMVEPELGPGTGELEALKHWVTNGGTFVLVANPHNIFLEHFGLEAEAACGMDGEDKHGKTLAFQPGPYTRGVGELRPQRHNGLTSLLPEAVFHARSRWGGLLAVLEEGKGRIITLADPHLFSNEALRKADHARLALNLLLAHRGQGVVLVDEYHHGYGRATSVLEHLVGSRAFYPLVQAALLLLVLWAVKGRRFGPPRPLVREVRRSSLEYVRAMAQLFHRARAGGLAMVGVSRWIEGEAKKVLVHRDEMLHKTLQTAKQRFHREEMTEQELLQSVQGLYVALDEARRKAAGGG